MTAIISVKDKRCDSGYNTKSKQVTSLEEAVRWAKTNRLNSYLMTILDSGVAINVNIPRD